MTRIVLAFLTLSIFVTNYAQAAKVESINNNKVTIFLETVDDEDVKAGDLISLTDKFGNTKATLRVITNRGLMADTVLVSGLPLKRYKVKMPGGTTAPPVAARKKKPKITVAKGTQPKDNVPQSMRAFVDNDPEQMKLEGVADADAQVNAARNDVLNQPTPGQPTTQPHQSRLDPAKSQQLFKVGPANWNISMDILSLAGLFFDYQVFSILAERRVNSSTSLGATVNFGTFESNKDQTLATERPLVRRTEFGPFIRYNFMGDILANGAFIGGALKLVQEQWLSTGSFNGGSDDGFVATGIIGYQWMLKSITLRFGYQLQYSSLGNEFTSDSGTFTRSNQLLSGTANYAVFQFGFMF